MFLMLMKIPGIREKHTLNDIDFTNWYLQSENLSFGTCFESGILNEPGFKNIQNSAELYSLKKNQKN
jgi:hypothetical protein